MAGARFMDFFKISDLELQQTNIIAENEKFLLTRIQSVNVDGTNVTA